VAPERERLHQLIAEVRVRTANLRFEHFEPKFEDLIRVTSELLRAVLEHAEAIDTLLSTDQIEATAALERAAWEIWHELEFLVTRDAADEDATRSRIHAALEVQELATKSGDAPDEMKKNVDEVLAGYERTHPALVVEMRNLRQKRKSLHWSGVTRTEIYAPGDSSRVTYKLFSWVAHPIAVGARDVEIRVDGKRAIVTFRQTENPESHAERIAWAVGHSLIFAWNDYAKVWGFDEIALPWPH
jgi:hypothetical protein